MVSRATFKEGELDQVAKRFFKAFTEADVTKMKEHFGDKILFDGDHRFIGGDQAAEPTELTKRQFSDAYSKLFASVGREKWKKAFEMPQPTLVQAPADGKPIALAKKGDYVYDVRFRETNKGQRAGLDEAVIFIFRKVDGRYRIVAHYADY